MRGLHYCSPLALLILIVSWSNASAEAQVKPRPEQGSVDAAGKFSPAGPQRVAGQTSAEQRDALAKLKLALSSKNPDERQMTIGEVTCDFDKRQIRFPATLNMVQGELEYILVAKNGKLHESLLSTEVSPEQIHLAALLLGLEAKPLPEKFDAQWATQKLAVSISWERNGGSSSAEINQLFARSSQGRGPSDKVVIPATSVTSEAARSSAWFYHGSTFFTSGFAAQIEGSIIGLTRDPAALINPDLKISPETVFAPSAAQLPRLGSRVTFIISLPTAKP
jgi:hypothetical protein